MSIFKHQLKGGEHLKPEKNTPHNVGNNPDKKEYQAEKKEGNKTVHKKKIIAGKMDKYGTNLCKFCGDKHASGKC